MFHRRFCWGVLPAWLAILVGLAVAGQGGDTPITWLTAIQSLQARLAIAPAGALPALAEELRYLYREIASVRALPLEEPAVGLNSDAMREYLDRLRRVLEEQERNRPGGAFHLGRVEITVSAEAVQVPTATLVDRTSWQERGATLLPDALAGLAGVSVQRVGSRNERAILVRGFDARQVPVYVDGVPVYVPYDGTMDLDRFLLADISEVQVAKAMTSPLYGPNALGGAVNLVSSEPTTRLNLEAGSGYGSGRTWDSFLNAGSLWRRFWWHGALAGLSSETFPLSSAYRATSTQPAGDRWNAGRSDVLTRLRAAFTPGVREHYVFSYLAQRSEKDQPPYTGPDPAVRVRYWKWPRWDRTSYYVTLHRPVSSRGELTARLFHDKFDNMLNSFDDATYRTQTRSTSFTSIYDDDAFGAIGHLTHRWRPRHLLKASLFWKDDTHREGNLGQPPRSFRERSFSAGWEDTVWLGERWTALFGFSADRLSVLNAEELRGGRLLPFPKNALGAVNGQAGLFRSVGQSGKLRWSASRRTRLPTMKDRYSYRLGQAVPNPDLGPEAALHLETGATRLLGRIGLADAAWFWSEISGAAQRYYLQPNLWQIRNLGRARHLGAELSLRLNLGNRIHSSTTYTFLSRKFKSAPDIILVDAPKHSFFQAVTYSPAPSVMVLGTLTAEAGRYYQNDAGRYGRAPGFAALGLGLALKPARRWEVQGGVNNLTDRNYFYSEGYPEPGRTGYVRVRFRF